MARKNNDGQHLRRLREMYARERCLPSYEVIAGALGFRTKNAAFKLVLRLVASGHLLKVMGGRLVPGPNFFSLVLCEDEIRAGLDSDGSGSGLLTEENLSELLVTRPSRTMLVRVRGESMLGAGILSGDMAVVETGVQAANGDFVVAEIDGVCTIKEFRRAGGRDVLASHGDKPGVITPQETLAIIGVVRGIIRSYGRRAKTPFTLARQGEEQ